MKQMNGAPSIPEGNRIPKLTRRVMKALDGATIQDALSVCTNIAGQLCAQLSGGKPSAIQAHGNSIAEAVKTAAINKMLHDDEVRRQKEKETQ